MRFWLSLFFAIALFAQDYGDIIHDKATDWLASMLHKLDIYLSDSNESLKERFSIRSSIDTITETRKNTKFRFNIRANLELPRTQKRFHLFLQDYKQKESIDTATQANIKNSIENTTFIGGLSYLTSTHLSYRAGLRFHKITPDPFVSAGWEDNHPLPVGWLYYGFSAGYYLHRKFFSTFFANYQYKASDHTIYAFENDIQYRQRPNASTEFLHSLKCYSSLGRYSLLTPHFDIYSLNDTKQSYHLEYYYAGVDYHDKLFKKWLFYDLAPAVLWRRENGFSPSYRLMVRVGITFERN